MNLNEPFSKILNGREGGYLRYLYILSMDLLKTDFYSKPTDSHLYLPLSSRHPKHVFKRV